MTAFAFSVAVTPEGAICDSCFESLAGVKPPVRRLQLLDGDSFDCKYCGDPIEADFGVLTPEDLSY